ncbi:MAG: isocitrate/isopropylmalate dehydrogenase family protein [Myxococcota bacterium]|nr:isocitrate/isopropylmalate dehydrogenase family protein [Myxococcota bacterium]
MPHCITLIPGDGIGPEVADATKRVLAGTGVNIEWDVQHSGLQALEESGDALPDATVESVRANGVALKGPTTTPVGKGHVSANVRLRRALDLYASIRPAKSMPGVVSRYEDLDLVVVRENTEGLYSGQEVQVTDGVVVSIKVVTEAASRRIATAAFEYARKNGRKRVTAVHKANIMKMGDGFFLECVGDIAKGYPEIQYDTAIIDALCMQLVRNPNVFDVMLMENLYGDIISDLCAGLVGGLGVVPGANIGADVAVFEAVHGSAPDIAGQGVANPLGLIKSAVLMLEHIGELSAAERLYSAIEQTMLDPKARTADLGGNATTNDVVDAILEAC